MKRCWFFCSFIASSHRIGSSADCSGQWEEVASWLLTMVPWRVEVSLAEMVLAMLGGWVSSFLVIANDVARALRSARSPVSSSVWFSLNRTPPGQFCCVCPRMFFLYIVNLIQYCAFFPYTMMHKRVYSLPSTCLRQISIARICSILRILSSSFLGNRIWAGVPWPQAREQRAASCLLCGVVRL